MTVSVFNESRRLSSRKTGVFRDVTKRSDGSEISKRIDAGKLNLEAFLATTNFDGCTNNVEKPNATAVAL